MTPEKQRSESLVDAEVTVRLNPEEEEELSIAVSDIARGEYIDGEALLEELRSHLQR